MVPPRFVGWNGVPVFHLHVLVRGVGLHFRQVLLEWGGSVEANHFGVRDGAKADA